MTISVLKKELERNTTTWGWTNLIIPSLMEQTEGRTIYLRIQNNVSKDAGVSQTCWVTSGFGANYCIFACKGPVTSEQNQLVNCVHPARLRQHLGRTGNFSVQAPEHGKGPLLTCWHCHGGASDHAHGHAVGAGRGHRGWVDGRGDAVGLHHRGVVDDVGLGRIHGLGVISSLLEKREKEKKKIPPSLQVLFQPNHSVSQALSKGWWLVLPVDGLMCLEIWTCG